jgi:hypothetical protein
MCTSQDRCPKCVPWSGGRDGRNHLTFFLEGLLRCLNAIRTWLGKSIGGTERVRNWLPGRGAGFGSQPFREARWVSVGNPRSMGSSRLRCQHPRFGSWRATDLRLRDAGATGLRLPSFSRPRRRWVDNLDPSAIPALINAVAPSGVPPNAAS